MKLSNFSCSIQLILDVFLTRNWKKRLEEASGRPWGHRSLRETSLGLLILGRWSGDSWNSPEAAGSERTSSPAQSGWSACAGGTSGWAQTLGEQWRHSWTVGCPRAPGLRSFAAQSSGMSSPKEHKRSVCLRNISRNKYHDSVCNREYIHYPHYKIILRQHKLQIISLWNVVSCYLSNCQTLNEPWMNLAWIHLFQSGAVAAGDQ